jgi:hypothetical protein
MPLPFPFIPSTMDGFASLGTSTTNMSEHLTDIVSDPSLDPGTFRQVPQGPPSILDEVRTNSSSPDVPAYPFNAQVDAIHAKARFLVG